MFRNSAHQHIVAGESYICSGISLQKPGFAWSSDKANQLYTVPTHQSSSFTVVQVHHALQISPFLGHVYELSRELVSELCVIAASAPLPLSAAGGADVARVWTAARTRVHAALTASTCHVVGQGRAHYGVHEGALADTCTHTHAYICIQIYDTIRL